MLLFRLFPAERARARPLHRQQECWQTEILNLLFHTVAPFLKNLNANSLRRDRSERAFATFTGNHVRPRSQFGYSQNRCHTAVFSSCSFRIEMPMSRHGAEYCAHMRASTPPYVVAGNASRLCGAAWNCLGCSVRKLRIRRMLRVAQAGGEDREGDGSEMKKAGFAVFTKEQKLNQAS